VALAIVAMAACGGPVTTGSSPSASSATGSGLPTPSDGQTPASDTPPPATPTAEPELNFIAWLLGLGVDAPTGPPEFSAYNLLRGRDGDRRQIGLEEGCRRLLAGLKPEGGLELSDEASRLYRGAGHACLGAVTGGETHWETAEAALATLSPPLSCMDIAAYRLLQKLVDAHATNPFGAFDPGTEKSEGTRPPCPRITGMSPASGPRSGTEVVITGENLDRVLSVVLYPQDEDGDFGPDDVVFEIHNGSISLTVADDTGVAIWACVVVQGAPGWNGEGALFTFVDPMPSLGQSATPLPSPGVACPPPSPD
jgi:hypothetical protein